MAACLIARVLPKLVRGAEAARIVPTMAWVTLMLAGIIEATWALAMPKTDGFRRLGASAIVITLIACSLFLLSRATRTLPIGTAYAVWVGIGAAGAAIGGVWLYDEPVTPSRIVCLLMLLVAIVGLKLTAHVR